MTLFQDQLIVIGGTVLTVCHGPEISGAKFATQHDFGNGIEVHQWADFTPDQIAGQEQIVCLWKLKNK